MGWSTRFSQALRANFGALGTSTSSIVPSGTKADPVSVAGSYLQITPDQPIYTNWTAEKAIRDGFRASHWVYRCAREIAVAGSSVPWKVRVRTVSGEWVDSPGHPLEVLVENPNPRVTRQTTIERAILHLILAGNAILWQVRASSTTPRRTSGSGPLSPTVELWVVNPDTVRPVPDPVDYISTYLYIRDGKKEPVPAKNIIHLMFPDPANPLWGCSPLESLRVLDCEIGVLNWWKVSLQNRAVKDGILSFRRELNNEQWEEARLQIRAQHMGSGNARGPIVIGEDVSYTEIGQTPVEMDFINSRKMTREDICAAFGVPPPIVGILDRATYENIEQAQKMFWRNTVLPILEGIRSTLNHELVPEFGDPTTLRIDYDTSGVDALQDDLGSKTEIAERLWRMGAPFSVVNQRLELGFPRFEGDDRAYIPSNMVPTGDDLEDDPREDGEDVLEDDPLEEDDSTGTVDLPSVEDIRSPEPSSNP